MGTSTTTVRKIEKQKELEKIAFQNAQKRRMLREGCGDKIGSTDKLGSEDKLGG